MPSEIKYEGKSENKDKEGKDIFNCCDKNSEKSEKSDEDYWEEMLFISRGPTGWNIGCGCG